MSDDTGVGALLQDTNLDGAEVDGARWLSVGFDRTLCPNGQRSAKPCTGFEVPLAGAPSS